MKKKYNPGELCLRCGVEKNADHPEKCSAWGSFYDDHVWNENQIEVEVQCFEQPRISE